MRKLLGLIFVFIGCVSLAFAGSKYNSRIGARDFCTSIRTEDGTVQNTDCKDVRFPNNTLFDHSDYFSYIGINWDYSDVPGNAINWTDVQRDVPTQAINWSDTQDYIPTASINWEDITGISNGKVLCKNTAGDVSYCTSTVGAGGTCTCQ